MVQAKKNIKQKGSLLFFTETDGDNNKILTNQILWFKDIVSQSTPFQHLETQPRS